MTNEQRVQMLRRNAEICTHHQAGHTLEECAKRFDLSRARVQQILKKAGIWRPRVKGPRTKFLGVTVNERTKEALRARAEREGKSVSQLASDALDKLVK